jgi:hypothetical protein
MGQTIDSIAALAVYNDLRKIAEGDYKNRDSRLNAVDARMDRYAADLIQYARQSCWSEKDTQDWSNGVAGKLKAGKADPGPRVFIVFQHALGRLPHIRDAATASTRGERRGGDGVTTTELNFGDAL